VSRGDARLRFAGCAAVVVAALAVTTALAAATWTIRPGGAIAAQSGTATFTDTRIGHLFTCLFLSASGALKSGSGLPGTGAGAISAAGFHTCTNPFGRVRTPRVDLTWTVRATGLPWHVNFSSYKSGVVTGTISHMHINLTTTQCRALIDGTAATASDGKVAFTYADSTGRLKLLTTGGNLHLYHVMGCFGVLHDSDPVTVSTTFTLSPRQTFTSP
jgi:hypothetical protein